MEMVDDPTVDDAIPKILDLQVGGEIREHSFEPVDDECFGWDSRGCAWLGRVMRVRMIFVKHRQNKFLPLNF